MKKKNAAFKCLIPALAATLLLISCGGGKDIKTVKLIPVKTDKDYQYIDQEGKIVINPQFQEASIFYEGLALVKNSGENSKWGYIDVKGNFVVAANFVEATVFQDGLAWVVSENGAPTCIDNKGVTKFTLQNANEVCVFSEGLAGFSELNSEGKENWGFVNKEGQVKINAQFKEAGKFNNGKCAVKNEEGKWGYIDKEGKMIINYQFDNAMEFKNGKAVVQAEKKMGVIDGKGKFVINPQFSFIVPDGSRFLFEQDDKWGWADKQGKITINPQFELAYPFHKNELAAVRSGKLFGFIDRKGKTGINPQFEHARPFNGKLACVEGPDNKIGFIDKKGKYVVNPQFKKVSSDYMRYIMEGESIYQTVKTDFFNVDAIVSRVKPDNPEGLTFISTMDQIMAKFGKTKDSFSSSSKEIKLIDQERISRDATLSFYAVCNPWSMDADYNTIFNSAATPDSYAYQISLKGKGSTKKEAIKKAIENSLKGYTKSDEESIGTNIVYKNDNRKVTIADYYDSIIVVISPNKEIPDATLTPDTNTAPYDSTPPMPIPKPE